MSALPFEEFVDHIADGTDLDPEAFTREARLDEDLGLDSFDMVDLIVRVEELGVHLREDEVMDIQTVGHLYDAYAARANRRAAT